MFVCLQFKQVYVDPLKIYYKILLHTMPVKTLRLNVDINELHNCIFNSHICTFKFNILFVQRKREGRGVSTFYKRIYRAIICIEKMI